MFLAEMAKHGHVSTWFTPDHKVNIGIYCQHWAKPYIRRTMFDQYPKTHGKHAHFLAMLAVNANVYLVLRRGRCLPCT